MDIHARSKKMSLLQEKILKDCKQLLKPWFVFLLFSWDCGDAIDELFYTPHIQHMQ